MIATLRALLSLLMLIGFYVVAVVQFLLVLLFAYWLSTLLPGQMGLRLTLPMFVAAGVSVVAALWAALRSRYEPMPGVVVAAHEAAPLWTMMRELASLAQTRMPDEIRIVAAVNASVSEDTRLLGLMSGKRYLYLGLPLLQSLTSQQIRAIIAHELGHYSHAHTRLASIAYRGRSAIAGTVSRIHPKDPVGWIFRAYHLLYLLVDRSVSRRQELQADEHAVSAAGKAATISSLTEVHVIAAAFDHFINTHVRPRAEYGYLPDELFGVFTAFLAERQADIAELRQTVLSGTSSVWDTHPTMGERIRAIEQLPEPSLQPDEATVLVKDIETLAMQLAPHVLPHAGRQLLPWQDFIAAASSAQLQAEADVVLREFTRRLGQESVDLPQVLDLIDQGHSELASQLPVLLGLAASRSGVARWQASWSGPAELVDGNREPLPLKALARLARRPGGIALLTDRLQTLGIKVNAASLQEPKATARAAQLVGGLSNVKTESGWFANQADLLILDTGLILIETSGDSDEGNPRMQAHLDQASLHDIAMKHFFVPFEEVSHVKITRDIPLRARITLHDGQIIALREPWTGDTLIKGSAKVLLNLLRRYPEKRS